MVLKFDRGECPLLLPVPLARHRASANSRSNWLASRNTSVAFPDTAAAAFALPHSSGPLHPGRFSVGPTIQGCNSPALSSTLQNSAPRCSPDPQSPVAASPIQPPPFAVRPSHSQSALSSCPTEAAAE